MLIPSQQVRGKGGQGISRGRESMQTSVEENVKFSVGRGSYQYLLMKSHIANFSPSKYKTPVGKTAH